MNRDEDLRFDFFVHRSRLETTDIAFLQQITDQFLQEELAKKHDASGSLVGRIHPLGQVFIPPKFFYPLGPTIETAIKHYVEALSHHKYTAEEISPIDYWVVSSLENDYNPLHVHSGVISGIIYLKMPTEKSTGGKEDGHITFNYGRLNARQLDFHGVRNIKPVVGDFLLFPSWLPHTVYPTRSSEERRSISFNYDLKVKRL